jgi:catechol 2,3-dioxygenase-like lactoylglutathione lyase family enzyme
MIDTANLEFFVGIPVKDYAAALAWYEKLIGYPPTFFPNDVEAVWELAEHRYLYIEHKPERAGHAMVTLFLENFDAIIPEISKRGIEPAKQETYDNGVRKTTYCDADGNEIGFGGAPVDASNAPEGG